ncbi:MAG: DUF3237 domain-containing protein [Stenotrophobium sp.]
MPMFPCKLEHVCHFSAGLQHPPEAIGPIAEGLRVNFYITGGEISGPRLRGRVRAAGADWFTMRSDGVGILDVRTTIETHDGALVYLTYSGIGDAGADGYQKMLSGNLPAILPLRTTPRMHTAHPDYQWLNRLQFLSIGEADLVKNIVRYDIYAVR